MDTETAAARERAKDLKDCDLVLKGGVTSGLVYPKAVLELKARHRFRSIGGTSAGAVAAAFAAAAEYNFTGRGFDKLEEINNKLQGTEETGDRPVYLRNLFQGNEATEPLLNIVTNMASYLDDIKKIDTRGRLARPGVIWRLLRLIGRVVKESEVPSSWKGALIGTICGLLLAAFIAGFIALFFASWKWLVFFTLLAVLGIPLGWIGYWLGSRGAGLARLFRIVVSEVPKNRFGICSGLNDPAVNRYGGLPAAGEWLHQSIQEIAGRNADSEAEVLTFADLKQPDKNRPDGDKPNIELKLMVTNVSEGRPYVLPFDDPYIFKVTDFQKKLFPAAIVNRLADDDPKIARTIAGIELPKGYRFLPKGDKLPVAVAARISMSFPLFFSSVPLYALPLWARERIKNDTFTPAIEQENEKFTADALPQSLRDAGAVPGEILAALKAADRCDSQGRYTPKEVDLIPHWFSDGGIASNFPIHFFDDWLPKYPTFGITLRYLPDYDVRSSDPDSARAAKHYLDSVERGKDSSQGAGTESGMTQAAPPKRYIGQQIRAVYEPHAKSGQEAPAEEDIVDLPRADDTVPLEWRHISYPANDKPRIGAVPGFLLAVVKTMQNYRDNSQAGLASYRERVAQVRLKPEEGGFNLTMDRKVLNGLVRKGSKAGAIFKRDYRHAHHQWARLRVLIAELDARFRKIRQERPHREFVHLIKNQARDPEYPFRNDDRTWRLEIMRRMRTLRQAMVKWKDLRQPVNLPAGDPPPALRVTPDA